MPDSYRHQGDIIKRHIYTIYSFFSLICSCFLFFILYFGWAIYCLEPNPVCWSPTEQIVFLCAWAIGTVVGSIWCFLIAHERINILKQTLQDL